ncbi:hypothetical protein IWX50DRAFT_233073 [Phyllosticta citricarpa]
MIANSRSTKHISEIEKSSWTYVGNARYKLKQQLVDLYWDGVRQELENILFTLKKLQEPRYDSIWKEKDAVDVDGLYGFETFIGQVYERSRAFYRAPYARSTKSWEVKDRLMSTYEDGIYLKLESLETEHFSDKLRAGIKASVRRAAESNRLDPTERLAKMLLRSAGFLDIEKIIEHRPVLSNFDFWKRPTVPQMSRVELTEDQKPTFRPRECAMPKCGQIVHGSMFVRLHGNQQTCICEQCYRQKHYGDKSFVKVPKHCVFSESIDAETSRRMCKCPEVPHLDQKGNPRELFPVNPREKHIEAGPNTCELLRLNERLARAKYATMTEQPGRKKTAIIKKFLDIRPRKDVKEFLEPQKKGKDDEWIDMLEDDSGVSMPSSTYGVAEEDEGDDDIPFYLRHYTRKYPFGNVHMALRVGPLVIENGVRNTKSGALVSLRDPPRLLTTIKPRPQKMLAISSKDGRPVYSQLNNSQSQPKRIKAIMKQVVGWPFAKASRSKDEHRFIREFVRASQLERLDDPSLSKAEQQRSLEQVLDYLVDQLEELLEERLDFYMGDLAMRLAHPQTPILWDARHNNCQKFCDSLISERAFLPLVNSRRWSKSPNDQNLPLYLMSFVCRPGAYVKVPIRTKFDVPNGLTEEYLLKFRYGLHEESDIVDSLQEYWHDWGAFGSHPYRFQDLFPWDCSEAFGRHPVSCSRCNISKHVWAFPFDSWSIISLHLARDRCLYAAHNPDGSVKPLSDDEWVRNRLLLLQAEDALTAGAVAMAGNGGFQKATKWLHEQPHPHTDRLKLGGIHRAQPWSSFFNKGAYNHFFVAEWAHLRREDQLVAYEMLRDFRMEMVEVGVTPEDVRRQRRGNHDGNNLNSNTSSGCGGAVAPACAVPCASVAAVGSASGGTSGGTCVGAGANSNSLSCISGFCTSVASATGDTSGLCGSGNCGSAACGSGPGGCGGGGGGCGGGGGGCGGGGS